jgi:hypothetical protein
MATGEKNWLLGALDQKREYLLVDFLELLY